MELGFSWPVLQISGKLKSEDPGRHQHKSTDHKTDNFYTEPAIVRVSIKRKKITDFSEFSL